jgi:hypothetical protein
MGCNFNLCDFIFDDNKFQHILLLYASFYVFYFYILLCQSFELEFLFSLFLNNHFEFEHGVSFRIFSYYVLYVMTTIIVSINIKTHRQ